VIERLAPSAADSDVDALARLLIDAVESGAAVSFVAPLPIDRARQWWRDTLSAADPRAVFLVARDVDGIVGCVQLHPAWAPNQPHRADVAKLLVHRRARNQGLGTRRRFHAADARREAGRRGRGAVPTHRLDVRGDDPQLRGGHGRKNAARRGYLL
jgi:GNAT superfamily N-acetyltransferase